MTGHGGCGMAESVFVWYVGTGQDRATRVSHGARGMSNSSTAQIKSLRDYHRVLAD